MTQQEVFRKILDVCRSDPRYTPQAYHFVFEALDFTIHRLGRQKMEGVKRHVTGQELLHGVREYALEQYGFLTRTVFESWGVTRTEDFGEIVFNLVEKGLLNRQETDNREDFKDGYDFRTAFEVEYKIQIPWDKIAGGK